MIFVSAEEEARALRRAAARAGCAVRSLDIRETSQGRRAVGAVSCPDGWGAARMLVAQALEDARTPGIRDVALSLRRAAPDDRAFARAVHDFVKGRVAFVREAGEVFQGATYTLEARGGDCDDHARAVFAIALAGGLPAKMAFLHEGGGPTHAVAQLCPQGECLWAETTVDAELGEHPLAAADRLGLRRSRGDIRGGVRIMTEKDLAPLPPGYVDANPPGRVEVDVQALRRLGYLGNVSDPGDPAGLPFRCAVLAFQRDHGCTPDGLIGPQTRGAIARALPPDEFGIGYAGTIGETDAEPRLSKHLSSAFFRKVVAMAERMRARGANVKAENLLSVWLAESGLKPWAKHPSLPFYGLNQMMGSYLAKYGWPGTPEDYQTASAEDQLPIVERFYNSVGGHNWSKIDGAGALYLMNFLPAFLPHADEPDFVLAAKQGLEVGDDDEERAAWRKAHPLDWYAQNLVLDTDRDGRITVSDMTRAVANAQQASGPFWIEVRKRLYTEGGEPDDTPGGFGPGGMVAAVALAVGAAGFVAWRFVSG